VNRGPGDLAAGGVRVRGVYSTALTRLLLKSGIPIADASTRIAARFRGEELARGPAIATVKDDGDRRGVVILGNPAAVRRIVAVLRDVAKYAAINVMSAELYATYACLPDEQSRLIMPGGLRGILENPRGREGVVVAHVVRFEEGVPVLKRGLMVSGLYARLEEGGRHKVSEHIKGQRRALLQALSLKSGLEGWGIHWRSSAGAATLDELLVELQELRRLAAKAAEMARKAEPPCKITEGEALAFVRFSFEDRLKLDEVRGEQVPTMNFHHFAKTCGDRYSTLIDLLEESLQCCEASCLGGRLMDMILQDMRPGEVTLLQETPEGKRIRITGRARRLNGGPAMVVERRMGGGGIYDGLSLPREEGDYSLTVVAPLSYIVPHAYFDGGGRLKGIYINVNTPVEPKPPRTLWYMDFYVDVVYAGGDARVIDLEHLQEAVSRGFVSAEAAGFFEGLARRIERDLEEGGRPLDPGFLADLALKYSLGEFKGVRWKAEKS